MSQSCTLISFGFKYGLPKANYYFDVGFLKNPARLEKWNFFSTVDEEMHNYVVQQPEAQNFIDHIIPLIKFLSNIDQEQIFAFGCSAGRHRSCSLVEELAYQLRKQGVSVHVEHRDSVDT